VRGCPLGYSLQYDLGSLVCDAGFVISELIVISDAGECCLRDCCTSVLQIWRFSCTMIRNSRFRKPLKHDARFEQAMLTQPYR
jgi:hypothetical protein